MEKRTLAQVGMAAMERLDLPGDLAADVPRMELIGNREFLMIQHRGVLSYSPETVEISGGSITARLTGRELQLVAMTDGELRIDGLIEKLELVV